MRRHAPWALVLILSATFVLFDAPLDFAYVIPQRLLRLGAMLVGGVCVAWSAIAFQTLTGNRLLTPAIMGFEAVYLLLQAVLVLGLGSAGMVLLGAQGNFLLAASVMFGYAWLVHRLLLREGRHSVYFLLLVGLVLTLVLGSITQFVQLTISPGEFSLLQGVSQTSFNRVQAPQLAVSAVLVGVLALCSRRSLATLDVLALGREPAMALGVDYLACVRRQLALIAALVAISTNLLGPTAFMGVLVANLTYALGGTFRHRVTLVLGSAVAMVLFLLAQLLVEHVFNYQTTVGILINLVCGGYFLILMLSQRSAS
ncbi:iron chelate uptake ABC transporter family permease subunit [Pseudomonas sp. RP23018S]|uniref:iron chelate uptake ABC transporter family permease subunit n=1 Tax=Pseudomonas sp. RP23018S TaxID=3096037 RepID=UPI002ACA4BFC|nr:iron chelate uptake ABC transporter family permease subunit [Pseudomonas sp. RP23018S]MDZ5602774.1 iron chelate uptake ABC transporter family permease subunit [Pseudomonas sp. RP23018S]